MPSTCEFHFNNPNGVYYSGQLISGSIVLKTTSEKSVRNIRIRFLGEAKVHWEESESHRGNDGKSHTRTVDFRGNEVYIDNTTHVHGEGTLPPGTHTYNFNVALPPTCPTSCEGKYGHIRYSLWLILDRPYRFDNEFSRPITVLRTVDLNLNPSCKLPLDVEDVNSVGCWPCSSGKIFFNLHIPFSAYAPGQALRYSLHVQNQSMADLEDYKLEFIETLTFTAHTPRHKTREKSTVVARQDVNESCLRQMNRVFEGELLLPPMPPTTEGNCIVRVSHHLAIELVVDACCSDNTISVPIFIGNVPLVQSLQIAGASAPPAITMTDPYEGFSTSSPSAPMLPMATNEKDMPPSYADLQPPSFQEAVRSESPFQDPDANEHHKNIGFRPVYPMFPSADGKQ